MVDKKNKQVVIFGDEQEVIIDRSLITRKQSKRSAILGIQLQKAQRDLDDEKAELLLEEFDIFISSVVVSVPSGWLPEGITMATERWSDYLTEDRYNQLAELVRNPEPGEKKA